MLDVIQPSASSHLGSPVSLRVLLIENDESFRHALTEVLCEIAAVDVVVHAETEIDAMTWLASNPDGWDLAIVDLFLTQGSGLRVLAGCRVRRARQKMIVLTGSANKAMRRRFADLGADAVFDKALPMDELLAYCTAVGARLNASEALPAQ